MECRRLEESSCGALLPKNDQIQLNRSPHTGCRDPAERHSELLQLHVYRPSYVHLAVIRPSSTTVSWNLRSCFCFVWQSVSLFYRSTYLSLDAGQPIFSSIFILSVLLSPSVCRPEVRSVRENDVVAVRAAGSLAVQCRTLRTQDDEAAGVAAGPHEAGGGQVAQRPLLRLTIMTITTHNTWLETDAFLF